MSGIQCGQIRQNFATFATFLKFLGQFLTLIQYLEKIESTLTFLLCYWANLHCYKSQILKNNLGMWSHWWHCSRLICRMLLNF